MQRLRLKIYNSEVLELLSEQYTGRANSIDELEESIADAKERLAELLPQQESYQETVIRPIEARIHQIQGRIDQLGAPVKIKELRDKLAQQMAVLNAAKSDLADVKKASGPLVSEMKKIKLAIRRNEFVERVNVLEEVIEKAKGGYEKNHNLYEMYYNRYASADDQQKQNFYAHAMAYKSKADEFASESKKYQADLSKLKQQYADVVNIKIPKELVKTSSQLQTLLDAKAKAHLPQVKKIKDLKAQIEHHEVEIRDLRIRAERFARLEHADPAEFGDYARENNNHRLEQLLADQRQQLESAQNSNLTIDEEIERTTENISTSNDELESLQKEQGQFEADQFISGYLNHPQDLVETLKNNIMQFIDDYDAALPSDQNRMTVACIYDMRRQMETILDQINSTQHPSAGVCQKVYQQLSGMLWKMHDSTLYADKTFSQGALKLLGASVYEPRIAKQAYRDMIQNIPEIKPVTYPELALIEQQLFDQEMHHLSRLITDTRNGSDAASASVLNHAKTLQNAINAQYNRESKRGQFDFKYHILLLRAVNSAIERPGNPLNSVKFEALYNQNKNNAWFGGVKNAIKSFCGVALTEQPQRQLSANGVFAHPNPNQRDGGNQPARPRINRRN